MYFIKAIAAAMLAHTVTLSIAAPLPVPQLAGEGAACNSILSQTDNGIGYGIENAEDNTAKNIASSPKPTRRQLAGEGAACNSILSQTDNGIGYGIENAEDNTADTISKSKPATPHRRRQMDKIANGFQAIGEAAGVGAETAPATTAGDNLDGTLTGGAADAGAKIGDQEAATLENAGSMIPKRQMDKIAYGAQRDSEVVGAGPLTAPAATGVESMDGTLTSGAADLGAEIGLAEAGTLEDAGAAVPKM